MSSSQTPETLPNLLTSQAVGPRVQRCVKQFVTRTGDCEAIIRRSVRAKFITRTLVPLRRLFEVLKIHRTKLFPVIPVTPEGKSIGIGVSVWNGGVRLELSD